MLHKARDHVILQMKSEDAVKNASEDIAKLRSDVLNVRTLIEEVVETMDRVQARTQERYEQAIAQEKAHFTLNHVRYINAYLWTIADFP